VRPALRGRPLRVYGRRVSDFNEAVIDEYRTNDGELSGPLAGQQVLLVTHRGARTGTVRTTPLGYFEDLDGAPVLFASSMGAPKHPQWYFNLRANPDVAVELGGDAFAATARIVEGPEREQLWLRVIEQKPFLQAHQEQTGGRVIPLIRLERS
jgi:deazaflavin-dependent oxidoreductase (nitroreductase family)